jgi:transcriptional regulator with XRE-family HTH domain
MSVAEKIIRYRQARGIYPTELGRRVGVSRWKIIRWEKGEYSPDAEELRLLADALDVPVAAFFEE